MYSLHSFFTMNFIGCSTLWVLIQVLTGIAAQSSIDEWWCPIGWEADGNYCYNLEYFPNKDWNRAEDSCKFLYPSNDPHLASIHSEAELAFISSMLQGNSFTWFGLRKHVGNSFSYSDETTLSFSNFAENEPNLDNSCIYIDSQTSEWHDTDCSNQYDYICKMYKLEPLPACPDGGEEWGDSCYSFYSEELTKQEAEGKCSDERKNLVSIESDDENIYVSQNIVGGEAWLGLNKNEDGEWYWSDPGANYEDYDAWAENFPEPDSDCAVINSQTQAWRNPPFCSNHTSTVVCKGARGGTTSVTAGTFIIVAALLLLQIFQM